MLSSIARAGYAIEELYGSPQDIEGVVKDGKIFVVQTRPQMWFFRFKAASLILFIQMTTSTRIISSFYQLHRQIEYNNLNGKHDHLATRGGPLHMKLKFVCTRATVMSEGSYSPHVSINIIQVL